MMSEGELFITVSFEIFISKQNTFQIRSHRNVRPLSLGWTCCNGRHHRADVSRSECIANGIRIKNNDDFFPFKIGISAVAGIIFMLMFIPFQCEFIAQWIDKNRKATHVIILQFILERKRHNYE